jgi:histone H3/H4
MSDDSDVEEVEAEIEDEEEGYDLASPPAAAKAEADHKGNNTNDEDSLGSQDSADDDMSAKSHTTDGDGMSALTPKGAEEDAPATPSTRKRGRRTFSGSLNRKGRTPSVAGLTIPFRTVKKAMKLDPDIPIVQNEAAIMTTVAAELFLKTLAKESFGNAKGRGRNTIRYEDIAEARTKKPSLAFLETLLP